MINSHPFAHTPLTRIAQAHPRFAEHIAPQLSKIRAQIDMERARQHIGPQLTHAKGQ